MLGNKLLVRSLSLPRPQTELQAPFEPVFVSDYVVIIVIFLIPNKTIDHIRHGAQLVLFHRGSVAGAFRGSTCVR
ncbi:uncharacterized protein BDW47DRAFT_113968 [Aspergillus candidus]|uniref:Uncharacterized protein n=1 Tax=Aspergillus candidus TaxID=41067 RepID=A0A2I2EYI6_ASPCN|nr:hypothetical protein BDW47DRAFT_113968 [Aspergillus candidus]PLB33434.1 hypothetical protein BDW47DRAFT_113968 [Aspergillus candidus]